MNTISSKSNEAKNIQLQIKAKVANADGNKSTAKSTEIMDSPRGFSASKARRKVVAKNVEQTADTLTTKTSKTNKRRPVSVSATLHAQMLAGKNDSAEMYRGAMSPPASPTRSVSPKAQQMPARVKLSALSAKQAAELSDDAFDALSFGSDDEGSLNTGWNEFGIDSDSEDEASKPKSKSAQRAGAKQVDEAGASSDSDSDFLDRWNEWGMSDDE